jgi:hypothetical protein
MSYTLKIRSLKHFATLALGTIALLCMSHAASASGGSCKKVHARVFLHAEEMPTCGSPIGLCASAELYGSLAGTASTVGTSSTPTPDAPSTGVVLLTAEDRIDTGDGVLLTKGAAVLQTTGEGLFAEVNQIVGGSGRWAGATGTLTGTGTFINGAGEALVSGKICTP